MGRRIREDDAVLLSPYSGLSISVCGTTTSIYNRAQCCLSYHLQSQPKVPPDSPSLGFDVHLPQFVRIEDVDASRHKSKVVRAVATDGELANQHTFRVPDMNAVRRSGVHISQRVAMDPIGESSIAVSEDLTIFQSLAVFGDLVAVDGCWRCVVVLAGKGVYAGVGHVDVPPVVRELDAVRCDEVVGYSLDDASVGFEAIDLWPDAWFGSEVLPEKMDVSLCRIGQAS